MALSLGLMVVSLFPQGQPGVNVEVDEVLFSFFQGDQITVPITLVSQNEPQVGNIAFDVAWSSVLISLVEATLGPGADSVGAKLETELKEGEGPEQVILHVNISAPSVIPDGLLVALQFEVLDDMNIKQEIALDNLSQTAQSVDGQELNAQGISGSITPLEFLPACLFYMH